MSFLRLPWLITFLTVTLLTTTVSASTNDASLAKLESGLEALGTASELRANIVAMAEYTYYLKGENDRLEIPTAQILKITEHMDGAEDALLLMTVKMIIQAYRTTDDTSALDNLIEAETAKGMEPLELAYTLRNHLEITGWDTGTAGQAIEAMWQAAQSDVNDDANIPVIGYSCCH
ncbi:MAG: hypothetical protein GX855_00670 [Firmicutes bacterium]|nr:hypothetical protein [Bacillota bacterium]